jgi:hypothetical protein
MRVIGVRALLVAMGEAGIDLDEWVESDFDPIPSLGNATGCEISCMVGEALAARGVRDARVMKLDGAAGARKALSAFTGSAGMAPGSTVAIELTFCENGCAHGPDFTQDNVSSYSTR